MGLEINVFVNIADKAPDFFIYLQAAQFVDVVTICIIVRMSASFKQPDWCSSYYVWIV